MPAAVGNGVRHLSVSENTNLKDAIGKLIPKEMERVHEFRSKFGKTKLGEIEVDMV